MRKTLVLVATLVMLAAVAGLGAAYASQDGETIRLRGTWLDFHELDLGETGSSVFDQSILTGRLFSRSGDKEAGHVALQCIAVAPISFDPPSGESLCTASYVLERGQILNAGLNQVAEFGPGGEFSVAVVGGTGAYRDAAGEIIVKEISEEEFEVTIHLE